MANGLQLEIHRVAGEVLFHAFSLWTPPFQQHRQWLNERRRCTCRTNDSSCCTSVRGMISSLSTKNQVSRNQILDLSEPQEILQLDLPGFSHALSIYRIFRRGGILDSLIFLILNLRFCIGQYKCVQYSITEKFHLDLITCQFAKIKSIRKIPALRYNVL